MHCSFFGPGKKKNLAELGALKVENNKEADLESMMPVPSWSYKNGLSAILTILYKIVGKRRNGENVTCQKKSLSKTLS